MLSDSDSYLMGEALQALKLLPDTTVMQAERAFDRAIHHIVAMEEGLRDRNEERPGHELPETLVSSLIRDRLQAPEELGLDRPAVEDMRAAFAICQIREVVCTTKEDICEEQEAPRRSEVRDKLDFISAHGHDFANAFESPYVIEALERELRSRQESKEGVGAPRPENAGEAKAPDFWCAFEEPGGLNVAVQNLREAANLAKQALERRIPLITREGYAYGRPHYDDVGGKGKAYSVYNLPPKRGFVMRCLALFGEYRTGVASAVQDGPFANFAQAVWILATGKSENLEKAISSTFRDIRDSNASPALLAALIDLPEGTLPPTKTRQ